jgi:chemotaxis protein methyltransferase CheR
MAVNVSADAQEFELSDAVFDRLRDLVRRHTGISLAESKRELVYGRLARRLRALQLNSFADYCALIESGPTAEVQELTNAITTNLTSFFRENHHFEQLAAEILPQVEQNRGSGKRMRLWSAGCSTGEEPYSIAMTLRESLAHLRDWDIKLLATDIDSKVVQTAAAGVYGHDRLKGISAERLKRWFAPLPARANSCEASRELKSLITFKQLNLFHTWPMKGPFDVIFCRNVVIYFDKDTQRGLFERMAELQQPGAWLIIGHSESLFNVTSRYRLVSRTVYRRIE